MAIKIGGTDISAIKLGSVDVDRVMLGSVQIWPDSNTGNWKIFDSNNHMMTYYCNGIFGTDGLLYFTASDDDTSYFSVFTLDTSGNCVDLGLNNVDAYESHLAFIGTDLFVFFTMNSGSIDYYKYSDETWDSPVTILGSDCFDFVCVPGPTGTAIEMAYCGYQDGTTDFYLQFRTFDGSTLSDPILLQARPDDSEVFFSTHNGTRAILLRLRSTSGISPYYYQTYTFYLSTSTDGVNFTTAQVESLYKPDTGIAYVADFTINSAGIFILQVTRQTDPSVNRLLLKQYTTSGVTRTETILETDSEFGYIVDDAAFGNCTTLESDEFEVYYRKRSGYNLYKTLVTDTTITESLVDSWDVNNFWDNFLNFPRSYGNVSIPTLALVEPYFSYENNTYSNKNGLLGGWTVNT